jgi:N-methyl-L-tryptophan oxidase
MEKTRYDMIVVGLGCAGLSTAYHYSTQVQDAKILGIDMNSKPGDAYTSSYGHTRLFNHTPGFKMRNDMLEDSLKIWKEIEEKSQTDIIHKSSLFFFGSKEDRMVKDAQKELPETSFLSSEKIAETYPAFENLPDDYVGFHIDKSGVIKCQVALNAYKDLCTENGIEMKFNTKVIEVSKNQVKTEDGTTYDADNVVVTTGPFTGEDFKVDDPDLVSIEQEFYEFTEHEGLPDMFIESGEFGAFNGSIDQDDLKSFKIGMHQKANLEHVQKYLRHRLPSKSENIINNGQRKIAKW